MARENSIIAVGADDQNVEYEFGRDLTLHVFALKDSACADIKKICTETICLRSVPKTKAERSLSGLTAQRKTFLSCCAM